ncbi:beta-galactosidase [Opitutus sp. GAS368]|jgi:hypothetical protein|uniref:beta-galactosidase n=1 Tax=Opitutus sp. GAS368 TaxID=1882749 RepID=UPI0008798FD2|nr:beta-galactosidase [Opitutus sp. GAS368]SDR84679.1 Beta-galactosidase [Opitutus sp. GAS368]
MRNPVHATVESRAGRATLLLDGRPVTPQIYALTDCPGARWTWEEVPARNIALFAAQGGELFQADIWLEQLLGPDDTMDFTLVRRQVAGVLAAAPNAYVMLRVHLNAPPAWCTAHPDECCAYADGPAQPEVRWGLERWVGRDNDMPVRASFYSDKWRAWARRQLARFCAGLAATPEGAAVFSLQVANGVYGEWHQWGFFCHDPDTSPAATGVFRRWVQARYGDEAALARAWAQPGLTWAGVTPPASPAREAADLALLRDPARQRAVIDYYTFLHEETADTVIAMAKTVRDSWPRPIATASFFGYFYCLFGREAAGGHLGIARVLASPHLDLVCATPAYTPTAMPLGGSGNSRGVVDAVRRAGKVWVDEMDRATTVSPCPWDKTFTSTLEEDVAVLRRNLLVPVTRGGGAWCFDFGPIAGTPAFARMGNIGWWDEPTIQREWGRIRALAQSRAGRPFVREADVLVIHDPWSFAHIASARHIPEKTVFGVMPISSVDPVSRLLTDGVVESFHQSGVIHGDALLSELPALDFSPYRMVVFATTVVLDDVQWKLIMEKIAVAGRHVVLLGYAGWSNGTAVGPELANRWTRFSTRLHPASPAVQTLQFDGRTEVLSLDRAFPVPAFAAPDAQVIGRWADGEPSAVRRADATSTWWSFALPPNKPSTWRALARQAGCRVLNEHDETTLLGDGLLLVHTAAGGPRTLRLPNGRVVQVTLPSKSTTVFDSDTGAVLLG